MSPIAEIAVCVGLGIAAGALSGLLGIGGGSLLPPLLALLLGIEQHRAQGISLAALVPPVGLPAVIAYRRAGVRIDVRLVALAVLGFLFGGIAGAWLAHRVPARELRWMFVAFLIVSAWRAIGEKKGRAAPPGQTEPAPRSSALELMGLPIGVIAGTMSGLLGVGGGLVALPLFRRFAGQDRLEAQAATLAMMLPPIGLPAVWVYAKEQGGLPWPLFGAVALGFLGGSGIGARIAGRMSDKVAGRVYAAFLVVVAAMLLTKS